VLLLAAGPQEPPFPAWPGAKKKKVMSSSLRARPPKIFYFAKCSRSSKRCASYLLSSNLSTQVERGDLVHLFKARLIPFSVLQNSTIWLRKLPKTVVGT